jgi:predicted GTPase
MSRNSSDYSDYETREEYILVMGATGAGKTSVRLWVYVSHAFIVSDLPFPFVTIVYQHCHQLDFTD